ncbi:hypothetical protein QTO34_007968 [Cnephaeus nilssonii]|uniref:Uncharacterized protein n=1 Tax=Cnephaeus nilssonii TaxID=3371016 RepID=A0AA40LTQ9_CNENI|nr:hypothetical protein QTO34_007968 [Eptesicus nilssonii]
MRAPQLDVLCKFVIKAWNDIDAETVIKSFKKCGISNPLDGMEDDYLWQDEEEAKLRPQHLIRNSIHRMTALQMYHKMSLIRNIIKDRIMRLNTNVQHQLKRDIRKCKYFLISLDETTDVTSHAQLAIIGRYSDDLTMREQLIKLVSVSTSKSGSEICKVVIQTFRDLSIDISKVVSVTTDGAPNVEGGKKAIGHPIVPSHCIIHQEALCAKAGFADLNDLMSVVTKIVNLIAAHPLHKREFSALLLEVDSTYSGLLMYNNVRWLSRGKVLKRSVECFEEIKVFLDDKDLGNFPQLNDEKWVSTLMFFKDLSVHINELNLKLQGFGKSIDVMFGYIKAFESKVNIFKRDVETKTYKYFLRVTKCGEGQRSCTK